MQKGEVRHYVSSLRFVAKAIIELPSKYFVLKNRVFESREKLCCPQYLAMFRQHDQGK
jgi:hypothetical protein